jgi:hypothetical protein
MIFIFFLLVGHPIKHGRLKVCVTSNEMLNEAKDVKHILDNEGNDDSYVQENLNHTVCQILKVRVSDNPHACSSCHSEDCFSAEMSMFKKVSILSVSITPSSFSSTRLSHPPPFTTSIGGILTLV